MKKSELELKKNENKREREERLKLKTKNRRERGERESLPRGREGVSREGERECPKLEPWCCYIVFFSPKAYKYVLNPSP